MYKAHSVKAMEAQEHLEAEHWYLLPQAQSKLESP